MGDLASISWLEGLLLPALPAPAPLPPPPNDVVLSLGGGRETEGGERADTALDCLGDAPADDNGDDTNDDGCARRFRCGRGLRTSGDEVSTLGAPNFDSPPTARRPRRREPLFLSGDGSASIRGRDFFENRGGGGFRSLGGVSSDLELTPMRSSRDGRADHGSRAYQDCVVVLLPGVSGFATRPSQGLGYSSLRQHTTARPRRRRDRGRRWL